VTTAAGGRALARFVIDVASVYTRLVVHDWLRSLR
jgi:hypothetical protein